MSSNIVRPVETNRCCSGLVEDTVAAVVDVFAGANGERSCEEDEYGRRETVTMQDPKKPSSEEEDAQEKAKGKGKSKCGCKGKTKAHRPCWHCGNVHLN